MFNLLLILKMMAAFLPKSILNGLIWNNLGISEVLINQVSGCLLVQPFMYTLNDSGIWGCHIRSNSSLLWKVSEWVCAYSFGGTDDHLIGKVIYVIIVLELWVHVQGLLLGLK